MFLCKKSVNCILQRGTKQMVYYRRFIRNLLNRFNMVTYVYSIFTHAVIWMLLHSLTLHLITGGTIAGLYKTRAMENVMNKRYIIMTVNTNAMQDVIGCNIPRDRREDILGFFFLGMLCIYMVF